IKGDAVIEWTDKKEMSYGDFKVIIPQFTGNNFHYDASQKALLYTLKIKEPISFNEGKVTITNVAYETITTSQLGDLASENIPKTINASLNVSISRDIKDAFINLSPIIKDDFGFKRIKSFSYQVDANTTRISQSSKSASTNSIINSVLATGNWYQFYVEKSGVYKITKTFLQQLGLDPNTLDPRKIKIYGNGGRMLPLSNSIFYPNDLSENAIQINGEVDGIFNNDDYILFYAEGVDTWNQESLTFTNLYDTKSYYYITIQGADGKRIAPMAQPSGSSTLNITSFDNQQYHEVDLINVARLGRQWFGESFEVKDEQEFDFNFPNFDPSTPVKVLLTAASAAFTPTTLNVTANGTAVGT
ncbi:MAG: peptidase C25, partial [Flavobacterium sp.]|nr:peptidase C25 [Flavobacterium sp.]